MRETSCLGLCHKKLLVLESGSVKTVNVGNESRRSVVERSRRAFALGSTDSINSIYWVWIRARA